MRMGRIADLRMALGTTPEGQPVVSYDYAKSVKKCAGFTSELFDISAAVRWLKQNPNHRCRDAWPRRATSSRASAFKQPGKKSGDEVTQSLSRNRPNPPESTVDTPNEPLSTHA